MTEVCSCRFTRRLVFRDSDGQWHIAGVKLSFRRLGGALIFSQANPPTRRRDV